MKKFFMFILIVAGFMFSSNINLDVTTNAEVTPGPGPMIISE